MKLLHVVASYLPATRYGGTIVSVHGLCRALAARGHEVHVFTTNVDGRQDSDVPLDRPVTVDGVHVHYFQSRWARRIYWAPALDRALQDEIHSFDVVHTHAIYLWPMWAAARRARASRVPYVMSPRGMMEKGLIENKSSIQKSVLIATFERRSLEQSAAIHVTSRREAEELRAFGFNLPRIIEIPNGVDAAAADGDVTERVNAVVGAGPYVLFLGRLNWKKGIDRLIRALTFVPSARVVLAGPDDDRYTTVIERLASECGVRDRIVFTGEVSGADKSMLVSRARALILPSYSENFGNVVLEAMAHGCPVIVTPEVGAADLVREHSAGLVVAGTPDQLGAAIATLLDDPRQRDALGERGRLAARDLFSWDAVASRMERAYESVSVAHKC